MTKREEAPGVLGRLKSRKMARKWYVTGDSLREYFEQPKEVEEA